MMNNPYARKGPCIEHISVPKFEQPWRICLKPLVRPTGLGLEKKSDNADDDIYSGYAELTGASDRIARFDLAIGFRSRWWLARVDSLCAARSLRPTMMRVAWALVPDSAWCARSSVCCFESHCVQTHSLRPARVCERRLSVSRWQGARDAHSDCAG